MDCTNSINEYRWELDKLYRLLDQSLRSLYSYETLQEHEIVDFGDPIFIKMLENSVKNLTIDSPEFKTESVLNELIDELIQSVNSTLDKLEGDLDDLDDKYDSNEENHKQTGDERFLDAKKRVEKILNVILDWRVGRWKKRLESNAEENHYEINLRYVELQRQKKINPATGEPHKKILHNNDNISNLKKLLDKIDRHKSKEQQYTQDETILSATPFHVGYEAPT